MAADNPDRDRRFVKKRRSSFPDHLLREASGLTALRGAAQGSGIDVPEVLQVDEHSLTLPFVRSDRCSADQWTKLGLGLASIHSQSHARFGFEHDNYLGLSPQPNAFDDRWGSFFLRQRLEFQVGRVADPRRRRRYSELLRQGSQRLRGFLESEPVTPSFLHGDLWHGNLLCGEDGRVWLIDPAPYYGDAEADLAMTEMFGGFPADFYRAYRSRRPASPRYRLKARIYNLYHYLNHLNLFGDGYLDGCEAGFAAFGEL